MEATLMKQVMIKKKLEEYFSKTFRLYDDNVVLVTGKFHYICRGKDMGENESFLLF